MEKLQAVSRKRIVLAVAAVGLVTVGVVKFGILADPPAHRNSELSSQARKGGLTYAPTGAEWASLTVEPVVQRTFRTELVTEGKVAIDEDRATPVFSPYAGRVIRLLARPGDRVGAGQPLFVIEATDNVQSQSDFIAAAAALNKAKSQLDLAQIQDKRARDLFEGKAIPLKDFQQAQAALVSAQNDMRAATTALEAARKRLRILGLTEEAIATFQDKGLINPETTIFAPIGGTVVQRKVGPGQYVNAGASDPVFVIGDLSTVWLTAFVRESEASAIEVGQDISASVLALPGRELNGRIDYVAAAIDPASRRLLVRATLQNPDGLLKPEMFANVTIYSAGDHQAVGVPKQALIYEGDQVRLWVAKEDKTIELRRIRPGLTNGNLVEVLGNLNASERIVTKGSLFIDRAASGS